MSSYCSVAALNQECARLAAEVAALRLMYMLEHGADPFEAKYNPNWAQQPRAPAGAPTGGQWIDGGAKPGAAPKVRDPQPPRRGHNRPPPDSLHQIFPLAPNTPAGAILAPIDGVLGLSAPGEAANAAATEMMRDYLVSEIRRADPSYRLQTLEPGGLPASFEGRANLINGLRADRAAALYRFRGQIEPLQVETLRVMQQSADNAYREGVRLYNAGRLPVRLSREEAIGNYIDGRVRLEVRAFMHRYRIPIGPGGVVRINNRAYRNAGLERTFRIPDARVGNVAFDVTLSPKTLAQAQIRGFFNADFHPVAVVIVRASQLGPNSTYLITRPREG